MPQGPTGERKVFDFLSKHYILIMYAICYPLKAYKYAHFMLILQLTPHTNLHTLINVGMC